MNHPSQPSINGDLSLRVAVDTDRLPWASSPGSAVWRRRVHLVGAAEAGQVTSVVRYDAGARFPAHDHPDGEEILVLQGVFSDEHGDWPAGTYLLNPEGFRHAPYSDHGCVLFVKLRQYPGADRKHVVIDTGGLHWQPGPSPGVMVKRLYAQEGFSDGMRLEKWAPQTTRRQIAYPGGAEIFILRGGFADECGDHGPGTWLRFPEGSLHMPLCDRGCEFYIKEAGLRYLRSASADVRRS